MPLQNTEWTLWRSATSAETLPLVKELQAAGRQVRIVREGERNDIYIDGVVEPEPAA